MADDPNDPNSYAPTPGGKCPTGDLLRQVTPTNQSLNLQEQAYVAARRLSAADDWKAWLGDASQIGYNISVLAGHMPVVAIGASGGAFRAAQYAAGAINGLDIRNDVARANGTGGLLQVASYLGGISGGSWFVGSYVLHGSPQIHDLVLGNSDQGLSGWLLDLDLLLPGGVEFIDAANTEVYDSSLESVYKKADAGFDTSITDVWSRLVSYHFLNGTTRDNFFTNNSAHGASQFWSNIPTLSAFQQHKMPFPLVTIDSRPAKSGWNTTASLDFPVYEVTPFEFGSWDPSLSVFADLAVAGTNLVNGNPVDATCVSGFDEAGFVIGTSSSFFNVALNIADSTFQGFDSKSTAAVVNLLRRLVSRVRTTVEDTAAWPNPFQGHNPGAFVDSASPWLELIDGGSNKENIPLGAMLVRGRGVDVIVALDAADDDSDSWPHASSLFATQNRTALLNLTTTHQPLPPLASGQDQMQSLGLNRRPVFFGCEPKQTPPEFPFVIYLPNSPPNDGSDPVTNTATTKLKFSAKHSELFLAQAEAASTSGFVPFALGSDPNWGHCLQCAAVDRARYKLGGTTPLARSQQCQTCFDRYCFDPASPPPPGQIVGRKTTFVDPDPQGFSKIPAFFKRHRGAIIGGLVAFIVMFTALMFFLRWFMKRHRARKAGLYHALRTHEKGDTYGAWDVKQSRQSMELMPRTPLDWEQRQADAYAAASPALVPHAGGAPGVMTPQAYSPRVQEPSDWERRQSAAIAAASPALVNPATGSMDEGDPMTPRPYSSGMHERTAGSDVDARHSRQSVVMRSEAEP